LAHCRGGILAADMGLGKKVMCLALLSLDGAPGLATAATAAPALKLLSEEEEEMASLGTFLHEAGETAAFLVLSSFCEGVIAARVARLECLGTRTQWHLDYWTVVGDRAVGH